MKVSSKTYHFNKIFTIILPSFALIMHITSGHYLEIKIKLIEKNILN